MAAELTGVMGHDVEGDKLAADRGRRMTLKSRHGLVVSTEMTYNVITKDAAVTLLFINMRDPRLLELL